MKSKKCKADTKTSFDRTLEITSQEEMDNLVKAFEESEKRAHKLKYTPEEVQEILRKSRENFCRRNNIEL